MKSGRLATGRRTQRGGRGFTLVELLVVVALVAAFAAFAIRPSLRGGRTAALQSAQAAVANFVLVARMQAMASGQSVRILVHVDPDTTTEPSRFLRCWVLQAQEAGAWRTLDEWFLPESVYVVPGNFGVLPAGLLVERGGGRWVRNDGALLRSTVLRANQIVQAAIGGAPAERWASFSFAANGTTAQPGDIVLTTGIRRSGPLAVGESPVECAEPEQVRGLALSAYGATALIERRESF